MLKKIQSKVKDTIQLVTRKAEYDASFIKKLSASGIETCYSELQSNPLGLSPEDIVRKQEQFGLNEIVHEKATSWYVQLLLAFFTPFNAVLSIVALVSLLTDVILVRPEHQDYDTLIIISSMILLSSLIRFWQEFRSNKAAEKLKGMITTTATVLRIGEGKKEIHIRELVPGDIIYLSAGDMIPADCRILQSKDLFISQSILTGESLPVEKRDLSTIVQSNIAVIELENIVFMGTNVVSGSATALVLKTGNQTYFGNISQSISVKRVETSFDKGVNSVSWLLIRFILIMVPMVFLINGFTKGNWIEAFLFALTVAVGLTPEMLPMIVTTNLAKGALSMSKQKVIVKRLNAIQNIGAMDVLCTDKTGTLTMDKIVLEIHRNINGDKDDEVLKWAYLNSYYQTGLKNLLDMAVLNHAEVDHILKLDEHFKKIDEIPFDFTRRRMSVVLQRDNGKHLMICKGATEEMIAVCSHAFDPGDDRQLHIENDKVVPLDTEKRLDILQKSREYNEEGLRVLLVAVKEFEPGTLAYSVNDETNMTLTGFIGFLDPPKPSADISIKAIQKLGVGVKVLTGDNEIVTKKICKDVGISVQNVLLGAELENMNDEELKTRLDHTNVLAKLSPIQKSRIIKLLQAKGHTVGFLGDGINDAPALRDADVGISVDTAVDIAKESADIILLERDLMVLRRGIIHGRKTFGNIIKYIKMAASSNFGNMFSVVGASAFFPFLPMLPVQILVQNLLYDTSQVSIPWDNMDNEFIETPQKWSAGGIRRFMFYIGPISSIFDYATFAVMFFVFKANTPEHQALFQSGWFVEGLLSQTLIVHMIRTRKIPFLQSWATAPVLALTSLIMAIGIYIPFSPFAASFKMVALPAAYFPWLIGILLSYCVLTQVVKKWFIKKFNSWL
ncbi:MAG: magnesium-translocating P-type ATPase [Bacteroidetes bacterium]|nr:magnesium-translocating P-type ATPase [Bacteroidota bacterium]MBS1930726.1 magnesium-translocating P-type ATPase [Bacteroidota bacterium]